MLGMDVEILAEDTYVLGPSDCGSSTGILNNHGLYTKLENSILIQTHPLLITSDVRQ
jgi:hypothetical protein